jgi:hypothetical protein
VHSPDVIARWVGISGDLREFKSSLSAFKRAPYFSRQLPEDDASELVDVDAER